MTFPDWLNTRYPPTNGYHMAEQIMSLWRRFEPYADGHFIDELCSNDPGKFQQRYWEMSLCCWLLDKGMVILPQQGKGPDIAIQTATNKVFIEAISPSPGVGPNRIPHLEPQKITLQELKDKKLPEVYDVPSKEILLRWTAAFKEKAKRFQEYIAYSDQIGHCSISNRPLFYFKSATVLTNSAMPKN